MASSSDSDASEKFRRQPDPEGLAQQNEDINRRMQEQYQKTQHRIEGLIDSNSTLPVTISSVHVYNAHNTRSDFLRRVFQPILSKDDQPAYTLDGALRAVSGSMGKLNRFDIFHEPISLYLDRPDPTDPSTTATDLSVSLSVREKSRIVFSSGTWAGSNDGSVYGNLLLRNLFGGAESLNANASFGTRTRSSYSALFDTPIFSNPELRWEIGALQSSTHKSWASHEERLRGGSTKLKWMTPNGHKHEFGYSGTWRQLTGLAEGASPTTRTDAGDSFKSSITHAWINDRRDYPLLPQRGYLLKVLTEIAGAGPLRGDVAFGKIEGDSQIAVPIPVPGISGDSGISFTAGLRGGVLMPLTLKGAMTPTQSRINDRFFLGGPTDVRGFRFAGLGPRDGSDAVGGDVYAAGGASLLLPFPRVGKDHPLRLQAFINGGRLLALQDNSGKRDGALTQEEAFKSVNSTISQLGDELPSIAAGFGVVYALPVARFELNFSLPLVVRRGEEGRKGLSLGVGISFL